MIDRGIREVIREHYVGRWAEPSRCAEFRRDSRKVEVFKWEPQQTDEGLVLYATLGGSEHAVGPESPEHRVELFTRLLPEDDNIARYLAMLLLSSTPENPHLLDGHTINYQEPILEGTKVSGFLILEPRVEFIPQLQIDDFHVEFLQVIPLFPSELIFRAKHGVEELLALWEKDKVPFWSMRRSPVPGLC